MAKPLKKSSPVTAAKLRRMIRALDPILPISTKLEGSLRAEGRSRVWYSTQKEHWLGWLTEYDGPGAYGRANWMRSAGFVYNHIRCPPMLAWLAEATGVAKPLVRLASKRVVARPGQSGAQ